VRLISKLSRRVVATSVLTGMLGTMVALVLVRGAVSQALGEALRGGYDAEQRQRCEASPETWVQRGPGDAALFAYDELTLRPMNPAAPPLDASLAAQVLTAGQDLAYRGGGTGGGLVFRAGPAGRCNLMGATWSGRFVSPWAARLVATATLLTVLAGALVGLVLVVWPLARRTARLNHAAHLLGAEHGLAEVGAAGDDELDTALRRLSSADARIRADAATLKERSTALQRHLGEVAHDVRTPLAALQLTLEQLADTATDEATREALAQALSECVSVSGITENLRMKSLVDDGLVPTLRTLPSVATVLERVVLRASSLGRRKGVTVAMAVPDDPVALVGDEVFLERCVTNLVDNAVRHGSREGHVAVLLAVRGGDFCVTVRDDGPGVSAEALARLGERTYRTDEARQRDPRGSGLGLAITRALCEQCGWSLAFEVLEPRGLEARLTGPRSITEGSTVSPRVDASVRP
jgi:signal transduction histidine kinase